MGVNTLVFHTGEVVKAIEDAAAKRMLEAVNEIRNITLVTLSGPRSGRTYKVPGTRRTYTASSPGKPPASRTGELRGSVKIEIRSSGKKLTGLVGTEKKYGPMLEFGTKNMKARPWLKPSFERAIPKLREIFGGKWFS